MGFTNMWAGNQLEANISDESTKSLPAINFTQHELWLYIRQHEFGLRQRHWEFLQHYVSGSLWSLVSILETDDRS
jgi:hypothetical protein